MADTGIARVYQFLQQNYNSIEEFKDAADLNGDGKVIKTEFRAYLEDNFEWGKVAACAMEKYIHIIAQG